MAWKPKFDWHPSPRRPRCPSTISSSSAFSSRLTSFSSDAGDSFVSAEDCFEEDELGVLRKFPLWALQVATDYFSQKNQLGRGYFGIVYKGQLADGSLVAVRRLKDLFLGPESQFQTELNVFNLSLHKNLLILQGFCMTPTERLLVYPYMANRSLAHQLRGRSISENPLDWPTRRRIALGSARGLSYLHDHCGPKFLYNGINATNILLDEEFEAVVDGYPAAVRGSIYHIAPEYLSTGRYSEKTDVFSYGIMVLELITGKRIFDLRRLANDDDESLLDWMIGLLEEKRLDMLVDPELQDNYIEAEVEFTVQLAILCSQGSQMGRPKMSEVVRILEGEDLTERWEEWKKANERGLDLEFGTYRIWKSDSTENLDSMELSSPR